MCFDLRSKIANLMNYLLKLAVQIELLSWSGEANFCNKQVLISGAQEMIYYISAKQGKRVSTVKRVGSFRE